jgi:FKBP12-rapamycin complex-associated protein
MLAGTYQSGRPVVRIMGVLPTLDVLSSKQHPRKLKIKGSDGRNYPFLLKGQPGYNSLRRTRAN